MAETRALKTLKGGSWCHAPFESPAGYVDFSYRFLYIAIVKTRIRLILLVAILIQAMIPAGFMPGRTSAASYIEICGADGLMTVPVDQDGNPVTGHNIKKLCAFSLLPVADTPPSPLPVQLPALIHVAHFYAVEHSGTQQTLWLPPSTAPPVLI